MNIYIYIMYIFIGVNMYIHTCMNMHTRTYDAEIYMGYTLAFNGSV